MGWSDPDARWRRKPALADRLRLTPTTVPATKVRVESGGEGIRASLDVEVL